MPTNHTDVDQFNTVAKFNDGEAANASSVRIATEPLADRTFFLRKRVLGAESSEQILQPLVLQDSSWASTATASEAWGISKNSAIATSILQRFLTAHVNLWMPALRVPKIGKITGFGMLIKPAAGHGGVAPNTMPQIKLHRQPYSSSAPTLVGTATDATAGGSYENAHPVEVASGLTEMIDATRQYYFEIRGEEGGSAQLLLAVLACYLYVSPS
jgi:hypothetical protein